MKTNLLTLSLASLLVASAADAGVIHVRKGASGSNDGSSWGNAYLDLKTAVSAAIAGDQIWVAAGTYKPNDANPTDLSRSQSFSMMNGVAIYGGFAGTETTLEQRDPAANPTILSGDLNGDDVDADGDGFPDADSVPDNTYHVFYHPGSLELDATAEIDGFTVIGGNASGDSENGVGGGMFCASSSPKLMNCLIASNRAKNGGGLWVYNAIPVLENCKLENNLASTSGGAVYHSGGGGLEATNCLFSGSYASGDGGAVYSNGSTSLQFNRCQFKGNATGNSNRGGAIELRFALLMSLNRCLFECNQSQAGGAMELYQSTVELDACAFLGNKVTVCGGAIMQSSGSTIAAVNCTFVDNSADNNDEYSPSGGAIYNVNNSTFRFANCTFAGNSVGTSGGEGGAIRNNAGGLSVLENCVLWGNSAQIGSQIRGSFSSVVHCVVEGGYLSGTNISTENPKLLPMGYYGGPTPSMPLGVGSSAINAGVLGPEVPTRDQRGFARDLMPDIGACEAQSMGSLSLGIPVDSLPESAGPAATLATVTRSGDTSTALVVNLVSGDTSAVSVPQTVSIPVGQSSASFPLDIVDDSLIKQSREVDVVAWAEGYMEGIDAVTIIDNDGTYIAAGDVSGTWPWSDLPYYIAGPVTVPSGEALTIEAGNTILFAPGSNFSAPAGITVRGTLHVIGAQFSPVILTSAADNPAPGDWAGVDFFHDGRGSMQWAVVEYAAIGVNCYRTSPTLGNLLVRRNLAYGIRVASSSGICTSYNARPEVFNCEITDNVQYGVSCYASGSSGECIGGTGWGGVGGTFSDLLIHDNGWDGMIIGAVPGYDTRAHAFPRFIGCHIYHNGKAGIMTYGSDLVAPDVLHCLIRDNGEVGVRFEALQGGAAVRNSIITGNGEGVTAGTGASFALSYNNIWSNIGSDFGAGLGEAGVMNHLNQLGRSSDVFFNISQDPLFIDSDGADNDPATAADNDYRLAPGSPCIDAGDPALPFDAEPEDNGKLPNIGLYGNTADATTSPLGRPVFTNVSANASGRYALPVAFDYGSDAEDNGGTYTLLSAEASGTGATIDAASGAFGWTPQLSDSGMTRKFFIGISRGGLTRVARMEIAVTPDADTDGMSDQWEADHGLNPLVADAAEDPEGDGVENFLEYAFGLNPQISDHATLVSGTGISGLPHISLDRSGPQSVIRFEYLRRKNCGLIYAPRKSVDLTIWLPLTASPTVISIDPEWERVIVSEPCELLTTPQLFGQVMVGLP